MKKGKSKKGKMGNYIILGLLICGFAQAAAVKVSAGNFFDTSYTFCFLIEGKWSTTQQRIKENNTSVYMKCMSSDFASNAYDAYAWGYDEDNDIYFCSSDKYTFMEGDIKKMTNYIYENGGEWAFIRAKLNEGSGRTTGVFSGLWSPDSI